MTEVKPGTGKEAAVGSIVSVHYVGTLADGKEFDNSKKRGKTLEIRLGAGEVVPGFDRGIRGMKEGGVRKVVIPPELGYGRQGVPPVVPPNATLNFEIELVAVES